MLKNIPVKINADKSITANYPYKIYQGEINTVRFIIDPSLVISDISDVVGYIGFKRSDNQKSGFVPLKKEQNGTYTYVIKDYWTLNIANKVWYTIKFVSVDGDNKLEYQLYAGNSSFMVNPLADYFIGDDIPPDASTILQEQIDDLQEQINNNVTNINSKLNKEFNTYPKLEWDDVENTDIVALNRINQDGTVSQYYAEAQDLYNTVNNIKPDENGNIELTGQDINISSNSNTTITQELNNKIDVSSPVVYYADSSLPVIDPMISVYQAEIANRAVGDEYGNNIANTYATKSELTSTQSNLNQNISNLNQSLNQEISDLNDTLSEDISTVQTQVTNLGTSISQTYATKQELTNGLNNKQDNLTAGTGINISNNVISSTVEGVKSELVYSGELSSQTYTSFQTNPTFTPKHYLVEYSNNQDWGSVILGNGNTAGLSFSELTNSGSGYYDQVFRKIHIGVNNNQCRAWCTNKSMTYTQNEGYSFNTYTESVYIKVYAINI